MLTVPIFTRLLTTDEYGLYSVYQSWYQILTIVVTLYLFGGVYNKGMIKYENDRDYFTSAVQGLSCLATFIFFAVYLINVKFWTRIIGLAPFYMLVMFAQMFFYPAYLYWSARQRFEYEYIALLITTCIIAVLSPLCGIAFVLLSGDRAKALVFAYAIVQIIIGVYFFCHNQRKKKAFFNAGIWSYALNFNLPLIPHYLSQIVLNQADRIMINNMVGAAQAAVYSVAYNISLIMSLFTNALNSAFVPSLYNNLKKGEYTIARRNSFYIIIIAAGLTGFAMLWGPELIMIFAPSSYAEAKWIIPPVSMSVFFTAVYALYVNIEMYLEKTKPLMLSSVAVAALNIVLNWFFILKYGYLAAGYTTLASYILFSLGHYAIYRHFCKYSFKGLQIVNSKAILTVSAILTAWMFAVLLLYKADIIRWLTIVSVIVFIITVRKRIINIIVNIKKN